MFIDSSKGDNVKPGSSNRRKVLGRYIHDPEREATQWAAGLCHVHLLPQRNLHEVAGIDIPDLVHRDDMAEIHVRNTRGWLVSLGRSDLPSSLSTAPKLGELSPSRSSRYLLITTSLNAEGIGILTTVEQALRACSANLAGTSFTRVVTTTFLRSSHRGASKSQHPFRDPKTEPRTVTDRVHTADFQTMLTQIVS